MVSPITAIGLHSKGNFKHLVKREYSIASNAAGKCNDANAAMEPWSKLSEMSLWSLIRAVSVELYLRYADWGIIWQLSHCPSESWGNWRASFDLFHFVLFSLSLTWSLGDKSLTTNWVAGSVIGQSYHSFRRQYTFIDTKLDVFVIGVNPVI